MSVHTVKVSNISPKATLRDMREFFSYSGEIEYIELESGNEMSKIAYITFKDSQGVETAQLFTGSMIMDRQVEITFAEHYHLPVDATAPVSASASMKPKDDNQPGGAASAVKKAEDIVSAMLARGFILGKDVVNKAKAFDENHQLMATASARVSMFDRKISEKVKEADEKYQVSEKTKSAYETAKERISYAGSALFGNRFVSAGMSWVSSAFGRVTRKAEAPAAAKEDASEQQERKRTLQSLNEEFARLHLAETPQTEQMKTVEGETEQTKTVEREAEVHSSETLHSKNVPPSSAQIQPAQG